MVLEYPSPDDHQPPSTSRAIHPQISGSTQLTIPSVGYMAPRFQDSINVRESMWKEIEKERIGEEIIAEEVARRRMLELEVRRELMMEEDRRFASLDFSPRFPFLNQQANTMSLVSGLGARHAMEQIPEVPFQHRASEPNVSTLTAEQEILQMQPSLEPGLRKDSGVLLAKPDTILSGEKRKAITPTAEIADKPSLSSALKKNVNEWRCALCQVSATDQGGLNDRLQGKKHKRKEAALGAQKDEKNCNISLFSKKPKFIQLAESCNDRIPEKKSEEGSSGPIDNDASLLIDDSADDWGKSTYNTANDEQNSKEHENRRFQFWCETCKIGTFSEKVMETHRLGKKHARRLQQLVGTDKQC